MNGLTISILWCIAQVTIISTIALIIARVITRRWPNTAAGIASWTALIALVITALVPISLPAKFNLLLKENMAARMNLAPSEHSSGTRRNAGTDDESQILDQATGIQFNLASLLMKFTDIKRRREHAGFGITDYFAIALLIGIMFGVVRLSLGFVLLCSLRRRAIPLCDSEFCAMAEKMMQDMRIEQHTTLLTSEEIGCAAVIGFIRPAVLLSREWPLWTLDERRAVLAHELAHVHRHDAFWRLIATICQIFHFYNPLMRLLAARLVLAQELAADQMAILNAGGSRTYLQSLSRLALLEDTRPNVRSQLSVTPVFSGHLMRRVEMLRAMDCKQGHSSRSWLSITVITMIAVFGLTTTAIRGFAQQEKEDRSSVPPLRDAPITAAIEKSNLEVETALFQRERVPSTHPPFNKSGGIFFNFAASRQTLIWPIVEAHVQEMFALGCEKYWDYSSAIESVACTFYWNVQAGEGDKGKDRVLFGTSGMRMRTIRDVDWRVAINSQFPNAVEGTKDGVEFIEVPLMEGMPFPYRVHPIGLREIDVLMSGPLDKINIKTKLNPFAGEAKAPWGDEWDAVSGGLLTVAAAKKSPTKGTPQFRMAVGSDYLKFVYENIDLIAFGIDVRENSRRVELRVRLRCDKSADAEKVLESTRQLIALYKDHPGEIDEKPPAENEPLGQIYRMMSDAYANAKIQLICGDSNVVECRLNCVIPQTLLDNLPRSPGKADAVPPAQQSAERPETTTKQ